MARTVMLEAQVEIDGQDLTAWVSKVEFDFEFAEVDVSTYGDAGAKEVLGGQESGSVSLTFRNDYAPGALNALMMSIVGRTPKLFKVRQSPAVVSNSNPQFSSNILVNSWQPIAGNLGDVAGTDRTYSRSGTYTYSTST